MTRADRFERLVRWFPPRWRERYGAGMIALLEDTYGHADVPRRARAAMFRTALIERVREFGLVGAAAGANERLRAGSLAILCGWACFMVAGADFAKFSEHWSASTPRAHHLLPNLGYLIVQDAGVIGIVVVLVGALLTAPSAWRYVRGGNWPLVRRPVVRSVVAGIGVVAFTVGLAVWAHGLSTSDRNGGLLAYEIVFVLWCVAVVVTLAFATGAALNVSRQLDLTRRTLRMLSGLALVVSAAMIAIVGGTVLWWVSESLYAPHFLGQGIGSGIMAASSTFPLSLIIAGALMLLGLVIAVAGVIRLTPSLWRRGASA
ncbi:MAG: hypothetical protein WA786_09995 [Acidimicrobiales bacterium]